jgi:branched-chain amino acid transport system permease protein
MSAAGKIALAVLLALVFAGPLVLPPFYVTMLNYIGLSGLVALGLVLLTGIGGMTSFGQAAFVGIGAYTTAYLGTAFGLSPWITLFIGLALTAAAATLLGKLTLGLSGHYLPLGTIAWGVSLYYLFGNLNFLGGHTGLTGIASISIVGFSLDNAVRLNSLIWVVVLGALWLTHNLLASRQGRAIRALKGGSLMAESMGVDIAKSRLIAFLLAALFAAVSGWLYAHLQRFVNPTPFSVHYGIEYLFMAVIGGAGSLWGALLGAGVVTLLNEWLKDLLPRVFGASGNFEVIVFGVIMVFLLQYAPNGLWGLVQRLFPPQRRVGRQRAPKAALTPRDKPVAGETLLNVAGAVKRFGGLVAVNELSLQVRAGEILALIGPNGAGKSTMFNLISGVDQPSDGEIHFRGRRIDGLTPRQIARLGLSRSFQHVRLLPEMSVLENVAIGGHLRGGAGVLASALHLEREEEARLLDEAMRQLTRVGLAEHAHEPAGSLPLGKQRILEIARALAADPVLLLLDEPAAGLRYLEKQSLAELLRRLRAEGLGILLVEHDMDFVMDLVDRAVVVDFGEKIAEGLPAEVQANAAVQEAYLGGVE